MAMSSILRLRALRHEIVIDLAGAQDDASDLGGVGAAGRSPRRTRWNDVPGPKSASVETHSLWRSSDFGVITISGLRKMRRIWRRSAWK